MQAALGLARTTRDLKRQPAFDTNLHPAPET